MMDIGVDIESIERFKKYELDKDFDFLNSIYSNKELQYCFSHPLPAKHLAVRFCAKEAFYKAISVSNEQIKFNEIEVLNKENGKPYLNLPDNLKHLKTNISLSHDKTKAIAFVIIRKWRNK